MIIGPEFTVRIRKRLQRTDFWPHPNVDTVLLEIIHRDTPLIDPSLLPAYRRFILDNFSTPKNFAKLSLSIITMPAGTKPSDLTLEQWVTLFTASH